MTDHDRRLVRLTRALCAIQDARMLLDESRVDVVLPALGTRWLACRDDLGAFVRALRTELVRESKGDDAPAGIV